MNRHSIRRKRTISRAFSLFRSGCRDFYKHLGRYFFGRRSRWFLALLLCLSAMLPLAIAPRTAATPVEESIERAQQRYQQGEYETAADLWRRIAESDRTDPLDRAMALGNLSLTYQQLLRWDEADLAVRDSLDLLRNAITPGERRLLAQIYDIQGNLYFDRGQTEQSLDVWQQAAAIYRQHIEKQDSTNVQDVGRSTRDLQRNLLNQGQAFQEVGLYPRACQTVLDVLDLEGWQPAPLEEGLTLADQKCPISEKDVENMEGISNSLLKFDSLFQLGNIVRTIGDATSEDETIADRLLQASLRTAEALQLQEERFKALLALGKLFQSKAIREISHPEPRVNKVFDWRSNAIRYYRKAEKQASSPLDRFQVKLAQFRFLALQLKSVDKWENYTRENLETSVRALRNELENSLSELPSRRNAIYAGLSFAKTWLSLVGEQDEDVEIWNLDRLEPLLAGFARQAEALNDERAIAYALEYCGLLYKRQKNLQKAENYTVDALNLAPTHTRPEIAYQLLAQLGDILVERGDLDGAIAAYTRSYEAIQSVRGDLVALDPNIRFSFRDTIEPIYKKLVELNLEKFRALMQDSDVSLKSGKQRTGNILVAKDEETKEYLDKARQVIEDLQIAELDNFFQEACVDPQQDIEEIEKEITVIYPIAFADRLEVIVKLPGSNDLGLFAPQDSEDKEITRKHLTNKVREIQAAIANKQTSSDNWHLSAQDLYEWLIRPIDLDSYETESTTLVFVLDETLRNLPMSVVEDRETGEFLIQKYAIAVSPGLKLFNAQPLEKDTLRVLISGAEDAPSFGEFGLKALPAVPQEIEEISNSIRSQKLQGEDFTQEKIREAMERQTFPIVHLATHGSFSSNPDRTFLLTWNDKVRVRELNRLLQRRSQDPPIELLVLSACETALGDDRAALGLAGIAIKAGARSTIATLWQINDASTAEFMVQFYEYLKDRQLSRAEALRAAQLHFLENSNEQYRNPYYWAAFILVGNWQ